ncbi:MAG TPA: GNAT family N-acetyltransferase [Polyangiaceae bacterium]|nr:GNAT family N-acetyltransferase [Polyangiaceae bacterium]
MSPRLATSGQPAGGDLAVIAQAGFEHLINLALPTSPGALPDEAAAAAACGLRYLHLPIDFEQPELERALQLFRALDERRDAHVFVHCAANKRVSALLSVYRTLRGDVSFRQARDDLKAIWEPNHTWRRYLVNAAVRAVPRPVRFETARLILRDALLTDAEAVQRYAGDPEVVQHMIWGPNTPARTLEVLQARVNIHQPDPERRAFELMIVEKQSGELVGSAGLRVGDNAALDADLGYVLARAHWHRGIMHEACTKLLEVAFGHLQLHRVWASTDSENVASQRVLEKLGLRREAHLVQNDYVKGRYRDTLIYAITEREYFEH